MEFHSWPKLAAVRKVRLGPLPPMRMRGRPARRWGGGPVADQGRLRRRGRR